MQTPLSGVVLRGILQKNCVVFVFARGTMMEKQVKTKPMIDLNTTNGVCL